MDMFNLMNRFTLDSIGEIGFGADIGSLQSADSPFLHAFDKAQQIILYRFVIPGWHFFRALGLGTEWGTRKNFKLLRDYSKRIVKDLKENVEAEAGDSFVGLFMKSGEVHSTTLLQDLVINFLIAGRDTTAQAMSWCFWNIAQHPEVEKKILEEADRVVGSEPLTYDHIAKLEYLQAVLNESLRLYPSVPIEFKYVLKDDTLPNGTFVPRGSCVIFSSYCMGRSPDLWGKDAEEFKPERWLTMEGPVDPYKYPVFHGGPRECLGKRLAIVEMKALMLRVLQAVKVKLAVRPETIRPEIQVTLGMTPGLPCNVECR